MGFVISLRESNYFAFPLVITGGHIRISPHV